METSPSTTTKMKLTTTRPDVVATTEFMKTTTTSITQKSDAAENFKTKPLFVVFLCMIYFLIIWSDDINNSIYIQSCYYLVRIDNHVISTELILNHSRNALFQLVLIGWQSSKIKVIVFDTNTSEMIWHEHNAFSMSASLAISWFRCRGPTRACNETRLQRKHRNTQSFYVTSLQKCPWTYTLSNFEIRRNA